MNRPEYVTDEMLKYLDALQNADVIRYINVTQDLEFEFYLPKSEAKLTYRYWISTYFERHRKTISKYLMIKKGELK